MSKPIEERHREVMNKLAQTLDGIFNEGLLPGPRQVGFTLLVFPLGDNDGRMNYISNAQRQDMLVAMKEFIAHAEGMPDDVVGRA